MKPTAACLAGLLMLVLLAGCKGGADESGARENKGDIEASGTVSAAGIGQDMDAYMVSFILSAQDFCTGDEFRKFSIRSV